jgi:mannose/fructose/N-acetylgalactosamine-specific phosphotransferase system component IID
MPYFLVLLLFVIVLLFSLGSISQSYATAQQAQAAIEASRTAQIASTGNLVAMVVIVFLVIALLAVIGFSIYLAYKLQVKSKSTWRPGQSASLERDAQPTVNDMLPAMLSMLIVQLMRQQPGQNQQLSLDEPQEEFSILDNAQHDSDFWRM